MQEDAYPDEGAESIPRRVRFRPAPWRRTKKPGYSPGFSEESSRYSAGNVLVQRLLDGLLGNVADDLLLYLAAFED